MKLHCNVIKDLLPLYAEDMLSCESKTLVSEHLSECADCKRHSEELSRELTPACDNDSASIKKVRSRLRKHRLYTVLIAVLAMLTAVSVLFGRLSRRNYKTFDESKPMLTVSGDMLFVTFDGTVTGYDMEIYKEPGRFESEIYTVVRISAWSSAWNERVLKQPSPCVLIDLSKTPVDAVCYSPSDGSKDVLLYGQYSPAGITLPRLSLAYYLILSAMLGAVLFALAFVFRKKEKLAKALIICALLPIAYIAAHLLINGLATVTYSIMRDLFVTLLAMLPLYALMVMLYFRLASVVGKRSTQKCSTEKPEI